MYLARLINECEDLLICDLAETYGILDYKAVKPSIIATLAVGLPESSRISQKYSGINLSIDQMLLAMIEDSLNRLIWGLSGKGRGKKPQSILQKLLKRDEKQQAKDDLMSFSTPEEYEQWMAQKRENWSNG